MKTKNSEWTYLNLNNVFEWSYMLLRSWKVAVCLIFFCAQLICERRSSEKGGYSLRCKGNWEGHRACMTLLECMPSKWVTVSHQIIKMSKSVPLTYDHLWAFICFCSVYHMAYLRQSWCPSWGTCCKTDVKTHQKLITKLRHKSSFVMTMKSVVCWTNEVFHLKYRFPCFVTVTLHSKFKRGIVADCKIRAIMS